MEQALQQNIKKFILFNVFSTLVLYYGIDKLLMSSRGLTTTDIVLVEIVYAVLVIFLEVPTGAMSDRWSRKYILALNVLFFMLNTIFWVLAPNLNWFLFGTMAASIHMALRSGTDTSFLYDTLDQLGRSDEYEKIYGTSVFWENVIAIPAGIIGPIIASKYGLESPFWLTLPFSFVALLIALSFTEPKIHRSTEETRYWTHIREVGRFVFGHKILLNIIVLSIVLGTTLVLLDEYSQLYFVKIGIPIFMLGFLGATGHAVEALGGAFARKLLRFSRQQIYVSATLVSTIGFLGIWLCDKSFYGLLFVFLPWLAYYSINPLISGDILRVLPSSQRATGGSFVSLTKELTLIPIAFLFSIVADKSSIFLAYGVLGLIVAAYSVSLFVRMFSMKRGEQFGVKG